MARTAQPGHNRTVDSSCKAVAPRCNDDDRRTRGDRPSACLYNKLDRL